MTRARELLILSGGTDTTKWPAPRPGGPPIDWIARAVAGEAPAPGELDAQLGRAPRARRDHDQHARDAAGEALRSRPARPRRRDRRHCPPTPAFVPPQPIRARPAPTRLSYSQLSAYGKCGYRFYLQRVLGLRDVTPPPLPDGEEVTGIDARTRGSIVHAALERDRLERARRPRADRRGDRGHPPPDRGVRGAPRSTPASPPRARSRARPRFAFALEPDGSGPLVRGFVDVHRPRSTTAPSWSSTTRPTACPRTRRPPSTSPATTRRSGSSTRSPRSARAPRPSRSPTACSSSPTSRSPRSTARPTRPTSPHRLTALAHGIIEHDYPVTDTPHRELCGDCPGREKLCSHPQSRTLRPPPAPWPGGPVRRSSPAGTSPAAGPPPR